MFFKKKSLPEVAASVYNYHNLGVGIFPENEEKTPHGAGERYNFDRMYMMVSHYDFTRKSLLDIGCNSGWFCLQAKLLGADPVIGVDYEHSGSMGGAIHYAMALEDRLKLNMNFVNRNIEKLDVAALCRKHKIEAFDAVLLLSVLHHIHDQKKLIDQLRENVSEVIFYEDHEFWNEILDDGGAPVPVKGEGFRFGWNEDMSWQVRMGSLAKHGERVLENYRNSWRREALQFDQFELVEFLGFSEKRRPMLALWKKAPAEASSGKHA